MFRKLGAAWRRFIASTAPRDAERHFGNQETADAARQIRGDR